MQFTTILAVLFSCLVLFSLMDTTNSMGIKSKRAVNRPNPFVKQPAKLAVRHENIVKKNGQQKFAGRQMVEAIKKRRQHK